MAVELKLVPCNPEHPGRKLFRAPSLGIELTVPTWYEDKMIRLGLDRGSTLRDAYAYAGVLSLYPVAPMQPCVEAVLRAKGFDPDTGRYIVTGGNFTCVELRKCFDQYVRATSRFPDVPKGRMEIAPGVYAPGSTEERCIKANFHRSGEIAEAYILCGAMEIIPDWTGALGIMATALITEPGADLYDVIKAAYMMKEPEPEPEPEPITPVIHEPPADLVKFDWMFILAAAGIAYVALKRK